jgi:hypothetical protein
MKRERDKTNLITTINLPGATPKDTTCAPTQITFVTQPQYHADASLSHASKIQRCKGAIILGKQTRAEWLIS